jgi:hypothetical protein
MLPVEETLAAMRCEKRPLLETAMEGVLTKVRDVLEEAEQWHTEGLVEIAEERAKGLAEVDAKRTAGLAEDDASREELRREIAAMHRHTEAQEGRVELNIGGYCFETSLETLSRVPHTFPPPTSAAGTRKMCAWTAAYLWIGTASTSDTSSITCAMVTCRLLRPTRVPACPCYAH